MSSRCVRLRSVVRRPVCSSRFTSARSNPAGVFSSADASSSVGGRLEESSAEFSADRTLLKRPPIPAALSSRTTTTTAASAVRIVTI